jgi:hypothetical protein
MEHVLQAVWCREKCFRKKAICEEGRKGTLGCPFLKTKKKNERLRLEHQTGLL